MASDHAKNATENREPRQDRLGKRKSYLRAGKAKVMAPKLGEQNDHPLKGTDTAGTRHHARIRDKTSTPVMVGAMKSMSPLLMEATEWVKRKKNHHLDK